MSDETPPDYTIADTPPAETDNEAVARLAKMPVLEYERCREEMASTLGCRVGELDKLVKAARAETEATAGRGVALCDPDPWPDLVTTAALLDELAAAVKRHVVLSTSAADALALWIAHTWVADRFEHTPRLGVTSPTKRCGKSTLLEVLRLTCRRTVKADGISASGVFRTVEALRPLTLLIDESDSFLGEAEELRGVLNSGFEKSGTIIRVVEIKGEHQPVQFATFAPCALAAIGDLPSTLADRALPIRMERKAAGERVQLLRHTGNRDALGILARKLCRWAADFGPNLSADPSIPDAMGDREGDISVPLLSIADHAGDAWAKRGTAALLDLFGVQAAEEGNAETGALLLADIRTLFAEKGSERMPSVEIAAALANMDARPWPEWKAGKAITANQLARALAPFRVRPTTYRPPGCDAVKGYIAADFADIWQRYLPSNPGSTAPNGALHPLHGNTAVTDGGFRNSEPVTPDAALPMPVSEKHSSNGQCYRVTDGTPTGPHANTAEAGESEGEL